MATLGKIIGGGVGTVIGGPGGGTAAGAGAGSAVEKIIGGIFGGTESPADLTKQHIQEKLASLGYPEFSRMQGWGGDETAKKNAMEVIYAAIQSHGPDAASTIAGYLEGGKITPQTINRVKNMYPPITSPATGATASDFNQPVTTQPATGISSMPVGFRAVPGWIWAAGGSLLILLVWLFTQGRPTA